MVIEALLIPGHGPLLTKVTMYVPNALALKLICPVVLLMKTSPAGEALNVPPDGVYMAGVGFVPVTQ